MFEKGYEPNPEYGKLFFPAYLPNPDNGLG
jgi:hypothetical protein